MVLIESQYCEDSASLNRLKSTDRLLVLGFVSKRIGEYRLVKEIVLSPPKDFGQGLMRDSEFTGKLFELGLTGDLEVAVVVGGLKRLVLGSCEDDWCALVPIGVKVAYCMSSSCMPWVAQVSHTAESSSRSGIMKLSVHSASLLPDAERSSPL